MDIAMNPCQCKPISKCKKNKHKSDYIVEFIFIIFDVCRFIKLLIFAHE